MLNKHSHKYSFSSPYFDLEPIFVCLLTHSHPPLPPSLNRALNFWSILQKCQQHRLCKQVAETLLKI